MSLDADTHADATFFDFLPGPPAPHRTSACASLQPNPSTPPNRFRDQQGRGAALRYVRQTRLPSPEPYLAFANIAYASTVGLSSY